MSYDELWRISDIYQTYTCHMTLNVIWQVYVWYMSDIRHCPINGIYLVYTWHMTAGFLRHIPGICLTYDICFEIGRPGAGPAARGRNALEIMILRPLRTGFGLQGCLMFSLVQHRTSRSHWTSVGPGPTDGAALLPPQPTAAAAGASYRCRWRRGPR